MANRKSGKLFDISVLGDKRLARDLNRLPDKLARKTLKRAIRKGAQAVLDRAREHIPEDTGTLKSAMMKKVRTNQPGYKRAKRGVVRDMFWTPTREELGIESDASGYYPFAVEYGFTHYRAGDIPAQSFMRRSADELESHVHGLIARALRKEIDSLRRSGYK